MQREGHVSHIEATQAPDYRKGTRPDRRRGALVSSHPCSGREWLVVSPTSAKAVKRCGLGAVIAAAYQLTHNADAAYQVGYQVLRPRYGSATLIHINDVRGHAAVLALFDEVLAAG